MSSSMSRLKSFTLECGHVRMYRNPYPDPHDIVFCPKCDDYRQLPAQVEYRIRCTQCRYARRYGADKAGALLAQAKHSHHAVIVERVERVA